MILDYCVTFLYCYISPSCDTPLLCHVSLLLYFPVLWYLTIVSRFSIVIFSRLWYLTIVSRFTIIIFPRPVILDYCVTFLYCYIIYPFCDTWLLCHVYLLLYFPVLWYLTIVLRFSIFIFLFSVMLGYSVTFLYCYIVPSVILDYCVTFYFCSRGEKVRDRVCENPYSGAYCEGSRIQRRHCPTGGE